MTNTKWSALAEATTTTGLELVGIQAGVNKRIDPSLILGAGAAIGDGLTEDTTVIQALITAGRLVGEPGKTYLVGALTGVTDAYIDLNGATLKAKSGLSGVSLLDINNAPGMVVKNFKMDGQGQAITGVRIRGTSDDVVVDNFRIFDCGAGLRTDSTRPYVTNGYVYDCGINVEEDTNTVDAVFANVRGRGATTTDAGQGGWYRSGSTGTRTYGCGMDNCEGHGRWIGDDATGWVDFGFQTNDDGQAGGSDYRGTTIIAASGTDIAPVAKRNHECGIYYAPGSDDYFYTCHAPDMEANNQGLRAGGHGLEMLGRHLILGGNSVGQLGNAANEGGGYYCGSAGGQVIGLNTRNNWGHGKRFVNSTNFLCDGGEDVNNSFGNAGNHDGIQIIGTGGSATYGRITGTVGYDDQAVKTQRYAINVTGTVDYVTFDHNVGGTNLTGIYNLASAGVNCIIEGNLPRGTEVVFIPANVFKAVAGSPTEAVEVTSAVGYDAWLLDPDANEGVQATLTPPIYDWRTFDMVCVWSNGGAGSGEVVWQGGTSFLTDGDSVGTVSTGSNTAAVTAPARYTQKHTTLKSAVAVTTGKRLSLRVVRVATDGGDDLANDAAFYGIELRRVS